MLMAITFPHAESQEKTTSALTFAYTLGFTPSAGNTLVVPISGNNGGVGTTYSVADNTGGGNYAQDELLKDNGNSQAVGLYRRDNIPGGITAITITCSVSTFLSIAVIELAGALSSGSFDLGSTAGPTASASATPGSFTPTTGDAVLTTMTRNGSGTITLSTTATGYAVITKQESATGMPICVIGNASVTGAQNPATTLSGSATWDDAGGSYKVAVVSNNPPPRGLMVRPPARHYSDAWG